MRVINSKLVRQAGRRCWLAASIFVVCIFTAAADPVTVTMQLVGPPPGPYLAGIYTSPYTATINGVATPVICDDFYTDVSLSTPPWTASVTTIADVQKETAVSTDVKFGYSDTTTQIQGYSELGYLSTELMAYNPNSEAAKDLTYAIWAVWDQDPINGPMAWLENHAPSSDYNAAMNYLDTAQSVVQTAMLNNTLTYYSNIYIYTPYNAQDPLDHGASQEYLYVDAPPQVPESGTFGVLAAGMLALAWTRRRSRVEVSA